MIVCCCEDFEAVFVYAHIKEDVFFAQLFLEISRICIRLKKFDCMPHMWDGICIWQGCSDVKFVDGFLLRLIYLFASFRSMCFNVVTVRSNIQKKIS